MKPFLSFITVIIFIFAAAIANAQSVDINSASADEIAAALKGVGQRQASAIVDYRSKNGPFKNLEELANVKGIGAKTLEKNKNNIGFGKKAKSKTAKTKKDAPKTAKNKSKDSKTSAVVDINSASAEDIAASLKGISLNKAKAIVDYRKQNGPFKTLEDITQVKGIGAATVAKNETLISFAKPANRTSRSTNQQNTNTRSRSNRTSSNSSGAVVNINNASAEEIADALKGIGPVISERIVAERRTGKFQSLDDLRTRVKGIGEKIIANNQSNIRF